MNETPMGWQEWLISIAFLLWLLYCLVSTPVNVGGLVLGGLAAISALWFIVSLKDAKNSPR